jgi:hypothetical protein
MAASAVCSKFPQTQSHLFDCLLHAPSRHPPPTTQTILYIKRSAAYLHFHCAGLGECKMDIGHTAYKECFCGTGLITKDAVCVCVCAGKEAGHRSRCCLCGPVTSLQLLFSARATRKMKAEQIFDGKETKGSPPTCVLLFRRVLEKRRMCISLCVCAVRECAGAL